MRQPIAQFKYRGHRVEIREVMGRSTGAATRDVVLYRLVGWGGATAYFLGIAIWYEVVPTALKWPG